MGTVLFYQGDRVLVREPSRPMLVVAGVPGPRGAKGETGAAGATYEHKQSMPATLWTINHNLGFKPAVTLRTAGDYEFDAEIRHLDNNTAQATLAIALAGSARCT